MIKGVDQRCLVVVMVLLLSCFSLNEQDQDLVCLDRCFVCKCVHAWVMHVNGLSANFNHGVPGLVDKCRTSISSCICTISVIGNVE